MKTSETPVVGAFAFHRFIDLDPREVVEVSKDGTQVRLWLLAKATGWLAADNYIYRVIEA